MSADEAQFEALLQFDVSFVQGAAFEVHAIGPASDVRWGFGGVLLAASVGRALSPSARVVVLLKSDFLAYYC